MLSSTEFHKEVQTGAGPSERTSKTWPEEKLVSAQESSLRTDDGIGNLLQPVDAESCKLDGSTFRDSRSLSTFNTPGMCFITSKKR